MTAVTRSPRAAPPRILVTGGAGFVGTNMAKRLVESGAQVRILDSLARAGSERNAAWLSMHYPGKVEFVHADVRDRDSVRSAVEGVDHIVHLAAQVAVTNSLIDPRHDFECNAQGTLNVLLAASEAPSPPSVLFSSTNKVYGALQDVELAATDRRYVPVDDHIRASGVGESRTLEFHSPYGCSKGAAEQYVLDFARSYGLRTVVLRMSCIYGPHQYGNEDQGWVAHFMYRVLAGEPLTIYGDGRQVRDILFVDDLIDAMETVRVNIESLSGRAFNMGGGVTQTLSLLELLNHIERQFGCTARTTFEDWRTGDQRYYVSDTGRFRFATGWRPRVGVQRGLSALHEWIERIQGVTRGTSPRAMQELFTPSQPGL